MQVERYFDFMAASYARNGFLVNVVLIGAGAIASGTARKR